MKDSTKIKVKVIRFYNLIGMMVMEFPEELRGLGDIYTAKNGWVIRSCGICAQGIYPVPRVINLPGKDRTRDNLVITGNCSIGDSKKVMEKIEEAIQEFNETREMDIVNSEFDSPRIIE